MARRSSLTWQVYKLARLSASGRPVRKGYAGRRVKNIIVGRALGRASPPRYCSRALLVPGRTASANGVRWLSEAVV